MAHQHDSHHHGHHHDHGSAASNTADGRRRVAIAAVLTFGFMLAEIIGGVISGSLALIADAAHMLTDAGSLALAWLGFKLADRPAAQNRSFGWARFKVLAAVMRNVQPDIHLVDAIKLMRIGENFLVVVRAGAAGDVVIHFLPGFARIL